MPTHDASRRPCCARSVRVARQRGRSIVAEGIETADLLEAVLELRFDSGQGYLLGRPASEPMPEPVDLFELMTAVDPTAADPTATEATAA